MITAMDGKSYDKGRGVPSDPDLYLPFEQPDDTMGNIDTSAPTFPLQKPQAIFFRNEARIADLSTGPAPILIGANGKGPPTHRNGLGGIV